PSGGVAAAPRLSPVATALLGESGDDGWGVYMRAREMEADGLPVVNLAVGEHDRRTDPSIVAALVEAAETGPHGYASVAGRPALRRAVAARLSRHGGPAVVPDQVLVTTGCQTALLLAVQLVLGPGHECLLIDPYYATYPQTVRATGAVPVAVPADRAAGFQADIDALARAIGPRTRAILLNTPNNPTGAVYTRERLEAIAALCRRHDLWLIADEVYDGLVHRGVHVPPRTLPGMAGRTLTAGSLSKSYAMTGWRVGWLQGPPAAIARARDFAIANTYGVAPFLQSAAQYALEVGTGIEAAIAAETAARARAALAALPPGGPVTAAPPDGAMYLMLDISAAGMPAPAFAERLLDQTGIACLPGESFGTAATGCLRLALVKPQAVLADTVRRIVALVEAQAA
ncbi:MAG: aminotransferase class I/II-fold pyridoxal phosphate-dependent enzyme, partial [Pseudomonadota bacterium]